MKRQIITLLWLCYCATMVFGQNMKAYEYWLDNDYQNKVFAIVSPTSNLSLNLSLDVTSLQEGLHWYHIRFRDDNGVWSVPKSQYFIKVDLHQYGNIIAYEYWFDDNYAEKIQQSVNTNTLTLNTLINTENLEDGLHFFHIRFKDSNGLWSVTESQDFSKGGVVEIINNTVDNFRYALNDSEIFTNIPIENNGGNRLEPNQPTTLDITLELPNDLPLGENTLMFQVEDMNHIWSAPVIRTFMVQEPLSVEDAVLSAIVQKEGIQLDWSIFTTTPIRQLMLERSLDGQHFHPIASFTAEQQRFDFLDKQVETHQVYYYRLKLETMDGQAIYSNTQSASIDDKNTFNIYPNPVDDVLYLSMDNSADGFLSIEIYSLSGHLLLNQNYWSLNNKAKIDISQLVPGSYILIARSAAKTIHQQFIKN